MMKNFNLRLSALAAAAALALAGRAQAGEVLFTILGSGEDITFIAPSRPPPSDIIAPGPGNLFTLSPVTVVSNGVAYVNDSVTFNNISDGGGAEDSSNQFDTVNSQYYAGTEGAPIFNVGAYNNEYDDDSLQAVTVTITAVPEPAAWMLLLTGFGALGGALRARRGRAMAAA